MIPQLIACAAIFAVAALLVWPLCWLAAAAFTLVAVQQARRR